MISIQQSLREVCIAARCYLPDRRDRVIQQCGGVELRRSPDCRYFVICSVTRRILWTGFGEFYARREYARLAKIASDCAADSVYD